MVCQMVELDLEKLVCVAQWQLFCSVEAQCHLLANGLGQRFSCSAQLFRRPTCGLWFHPMQSLSIPEIFWKVTKCSDISSVSHISTRPSSWAGRSRYRETHGYLGTSWAQTIQRSWIFVKLVDICQTNHDFLGFFSQHFVDLATNEGALKAVFICFDLHGQYGQHCLWQIWTMLIKLEGQLKKATCWGPCN